MSLVTNERTRLTATYLNGVAIAIFAIGSFAPLVSLTSEGNGAAVDVLVLIAGGCVIFSFAPHLIAKLFLGRLRE